MAQQDYVRRGQPVPPRPQNSSSWKKQKNQFPVSHAVIAIAVAMLIAFVGALYFSTTQHTKKASETLQNDQVIDNDLPTKPVERWRYIKELESRKSSWHTKTGPSNVSQLKNPNQLTDKQCEMLPQMKTDMRPQARQLNLNNKMPWNPWNKEIPSQHQKILQFQRQNQVQIPLQQHTHTAQSQAVRRKKVQLNQQTAHPYLDLPQIQSHTTSQQMKKHKFVTTTNEHNPPKQIPEKKDERRWIVQCGSFKETERAEAMRAQLALKGFDSHISTNNNWNRVVIGPLNGKENADSIIDYLMIIGQTNCIRLAFGG